jgi:hypothetical protein
MTKSAIIISYFIIVTLFAVLFKYGIHISFGVDTGFIGPIFIWHSILLVSTMLKGPNKK